MKRLEMLNPALIDNVYLEPYYIYDLFAWLKAEAFLKTVSSNQWTFCTTCIAAIVLDYPADPHDGGIKVHNVISVRNTSRSEG